MALQYTSSTGDLPRAFKAVAVLIAPDITANLEAGHISDFPDCT